MDVQTEVQLKPPKTFEEQLNILEGRGLLISNRESALTILSRLNYYRFSAYALTFKDEDHYLPGTTFESLYQHYEFDRKLRILLMEIIEPIEIAFRTHLAYLIAHEYEREGHLYSSNFADESKHRAFVSELNECINKSSKDLFIKHHIENYNGHFPVWVALEVATFGVISKLFANLKTKDKKKIARDYYPGVSHQEIENWLKCLTVLRNRCAHYSRLFNRNLPNSVRLPKGYEHYIPEKAKLFSVIIAIKHLTIPTDWVQWGTKLQALIEEYQEIDIMTLGFVHNWKSVLGKSIKIKRSESERLGKVPPGNLKIITKNYRYIRKSPRRPRNY